MPERRPAPRSPLELFAVSPESPAPIYRQLFAEIREAIMTGKLGPGTLLPSTRALARQIGVARGTVENAYAQLQSEGYLTGRTGSGTYVTETLPDELLRADRSAQSPGAEAGLQRLSGRGEAMSRVPPGPVAAWHGCPFEVGMPSLEAFPARIWGGLAGRRRRHGHGREMLLAGEVQGYRPLREAIVAYLAAARSVTCSADQVFIVGSVRLALDLVGHLLLDPGDAVWIEEPGLPTAHDAFRSAGARLFPAPVDPEGLDVVLAASRCPEARLAYLTPSHQFPLGMTMSLARRLALLDWARDAGAWLIEDDHDGEFRYQGRPLPALQGLDRHGRVIYVNSFIKILFPALQVAYLVVPEGLVEPLSRVRTLLELQPSPFEQAVLADFISEGHFVRQIRRIRALYAERQAVFLEMFRSDLAGLVEIEERNSGMHLVGWFRPGIDERAALEAAARAGVTVMGLSECRLANSPEAAAGVVLGYAGYADHEIRGAARRLANAWG
jgi:GntR family transcriptional regulator/MocR family aminotransferase